MFTRRSNDWPTAGGSPSNSGTLSRMDPSKNSRSTADRPLKMVIEGSIDSFLSTSRDQDRIILAFSGHAIEKDGKAYLAPLEGELDDLSTMIPLDEISKLAKCPAQEKLVIFDVCRFNPNRGIERPAFGDVRGAGKGVARLPGRRDGLDDLLGRPVFVRNRSEHGHRAGRTRQADH